MNNRQSRPFTSHTINIHISKTSRCTRNSRESSTNIDYEQKECTKRTFSQRAVLTIASVDSGTGKQRGTRGGGSRSRIARVAEEARVRDAQSGRRLARCIYKTARTAAGRRPRFREFRVARAGHALSRESGRIRDHRSKIGTRRRKALVDGGFPSHASRPIAWPPPRLCAQ